ncbi:hypothetical protein FSARC_2825 [Fusarium sarcochroum]|uniref:Uncharacterized protein n=1 Tax=Fusarium sarcochroum TaxID=1208366 RepID=A0A8H4U5T0_9HYPO|nr:hypothetical protein FSARC_2825 [Fusarium sarcochroum]
MRYEDWDVLLFPQGSGVPFREFKVECHLGHHRDTPNSDGFSRLPVVTCFVPSLAPGTPFQISLHSWNTPISQLTNHSEDLIFQTRLFVDGDLVASASLKENICWPHVITKGDLKQPLKFPTSQQEFLPEDGWSVADDSCRIKLIIGEGLSRGSPENPPVEGFKNLVVFSFRYAPQDILERYGIAWPNPAMWSQPQLGDRPNPYNDEAGQSKPFFSDLEFELQDYTSVPQFVTFPPPSGYPKVPMKVGIPQNIPPPRILTPEGRSRQGNSGQFSTRPIPPMLFSNSPFGLAHQGQRKVSQQMYAPSNGSVPMSPVQPHMQSPAIYGSAEFGRRTSAGSSVRSFSTASTQKSPQETSRLGAAERAAKRARPGTPGSTETLEDKNHRYRELSPQFRLSPWEFVDASESLV